LQQKRAAKLRAAWGSRPAVDKRLKLAVGAVFDRSINVKKFLFWTPDIHRPD
jgi:hypothetical protein